MQDAKQGVQNSINAQKPELPDGFQGGIFKGKVREGSCRVCDQLLYNSLMG